MVSSEELRDVVERYIHLLQEGTGAEIASLYAEDGSAEDPVGSAPKVGRAALEEFYNRATAMENVTEARVVRVAGNEAAAHFSVISKAGDKTYTSAPIDTFTFNERGEIMRMRAYWGPGDIQVS
ncbi:steroid delta-isomerase [Rhodococcus sp. ACPA4]|uniref:nuclear transport factor 2 family protein n=1 Tax=Rhodococcus TaxID=1827 RepID=UPI000BB166D6|nr:nuclear transport factor 2 family protein [Rhodococcus sp. ACPA4]PBC42469.1 steroid delta-isomerase [Rhodococcus sp. ACPA4]